MTPLLPQNDPRPDRRKAALVQNQSTYRYSYSAMPPLALAAEVPLQDDFAPLWLVEAAGKALQVLANQVAIEADEGLRVAHQKKHSLLSSIIEAATLDVERIVRLVEEALGAVEDSGPFTSLEDYSGLFHEIKRPGISADWEGDLSFARMRVAGPNPVQIHSVAALDERFPVTEALYAQALPGDSLAAAGEEGRLFLADYRVLENVKNGTYPNTPKFSHAPLALFAVDRTSRQLVPVAIQCGQKPGPTNPIFTPDGSIDWLMARTVVEVADGNVHQAITHLGRTHFFVEPFVVATHRQLAPNHPLGLLLLPHFQGTMAINKAASGKMAAPGGSVDELLAGTIESTVALTAQGVQSYRADEALLPAALAARKVDDPAILPDYPYRDDALLYWGAIHEWVGAYLRIYYASDASVAQDQELAAWYRELVSADGGRVHGIDTGGRTGTFDYLVDVATLVIFTASVQHAAVNFPQNELMTWVPCKPLACYAPARTSRTGATSADLMTMLTPKVPSMRQIGLGYMLGSIHYGKLGGYEAGAFPDERVRAPLAALHNRLATIASTIDVRNETRTPYRFLVTSGIPQSINV